MIVRTNHRSWDYTIRINVRIGCVRKVQQPILADFQLLISVNAYNILNVYYYERVGSYFRLCHHAWYVDFSFIISPRICPYCFGLAGRRAMSSWHKPAIAVEFDGVKQCRAEDTMWVPMRPNFHCIWSVQDLSHVTTNLQCKYYFCELFWS